MAVARRGRNDIIEWHDLNGVALCKSEEMVFWQRVWQVQRF